jgi:hypothetical protein
MENPSLMCRLQSAGDLDRQPHGLLSMQGAAQRAALDVLQHEIIRPNIVDLADMRMVQRGNRTTFLLESSRVLGLQPLNRDDAVQPRVARLPDLAHATRSEGREDFVRPKLITDRERHISDSVKFIRPNSGLLLDIGVRPIARIGGEVMRCAEPGRSRQVDGKAILADLPSVGPEFISVLDVAGQVVDADSWREQHFAPRIGVRSGWSA